MSITALVNDVWRKRWVTIILLAIVLSSFRVYTRFLSAGNAFASAVEIIVTVLVALALSLMVHGLIEYVIKKMKD
jgi:hypothetical protein